jgi:Flp pilus assembly pilin Flp
MENDHVRDELRYIRKRLDDHIDEEGSTLTSIESKISRIREEMGAHRVQVAGLAGFVALIIAGLVTWVVDHLK